LDDCARITRKVRLDAPLISTFFGKPRRCLITVPMRTDGSVIRALLCDRLPNDRTSCQINISRSRQDSCSACSLKDCHVTMIDRPPSELVKLLIALWIDRPAVQSAV